MDQTPNETMAETLANSYAKTVHTPKPSKHGRARTLVYVAGPFSGKGATRAEQRADTEQKIGRAARLGLQVSKLGAYPVVPHSNTSLPEYEDVQGYEFWIEGTAELLSRCDAVIFTPDWQDSSGARGEERIAAKLGIPRFYTLSDLACWLLPGLAVKTGEAVPVLDTEREPSFAIPPPSPVPVDLAKTIPTMAPESNLAQPFGHDFSYPVYVDEARLCGKMPSGADVVFDDEPGTSPEIPSLRSARPNTGT